MKKNTITIAAFMTVLISSYNLHHKINPIEAINQYTETILPKDEVIVTINAASFSKQAWLRSNLQSNTGGKLLLDTDACYTIASK